MNKRKNVLFSIVGIFAILLIGTLVVGAKLYQDVTKSMEKTYESVEQSNAKEKAASIKEAKPFSVLLMGVDTEELGPVDPGRSDTMMIAIVNPAKKSTTIVSIPFDTYVPIIGHDRQDKINQAYALGGASTAIDTVEHYLNISIDYYVSMNMTGLQQLVNAVGGIDVYNKAPFSRDEHEFPVGRITLDGSQALAYSRMRPKDPSGDYGRQERQRQIVEGIGKKVLSLDSINTYRLILQALENNVKTNMTLSDLTKIGLEYHDSFNRVKQEQLKGTDFNQEGVSYQQVDAQELDRIHQLLKKQLQD
ncbi:LCP family protein [Enterococcus sp. ZJ1668]|uniref:LCP family glycopolymer transferase n=1 Tax=Enterococcus sp. ZJ1668 TaxID=2709402 RepID=UPI0013EAB49D|nr:LCP family protein [Enterococcus sp. ZJ1668]